MRLLFVILIFTLSFPKIVRAFLPEEFDGADTAIDAFCREDPGLRGNLQEYTRPSSRHINKIAQHDARTNPKNYGPYQHEIQLPLHRHALDSPANHIFPKKAIDALRLLLFPLADTKLLMANGNYHDPIATLSPAQLGATLRHVEDFGQNSIHLAALRPILVKLLLNLDSEGWNHFDKTYTPQYEDFLDHHFHMMVEHWMSRHPKMCREGIQTPYTDFLGSTHVKESLGELDIAPGVLETCARFKASLPHIKKLRNQMESLATSHKQRSIHRRKEFELELAQLEALYRKELFFEEHTREFRILSFVNCLIQALAPFQNYSKEGYREMRYQALKTSPEFQALSMTQKIQAVRNLQREIECHGHDGFSQVLNPILKLVSSYFWKKSKHYDDFIAFYAAFFRMAPEHFKSKFEERRPKVKELEPIFGQAIVGEREKYRAAIKWSAAPLVDQGSALFLHKRGRPAGYSDCVETTIRNWLYTLAFQPQEDGSFIFDCSGLGLTAMTLDALELHPLARHTPEAHQRWAANLVRRAGIRFVKPEGERACYEVDSGILNVLKVMASCFETKGVPLLKLISQLDAANVKSQRQTLCDAMNHLFSQPGRMVTCTLEGLTPDDTLTWAPEINELFGRCIISINSVETLIWLETPLHSVMGYAESITKQHMENARLRYKAGDAGGLL